MHDELFRQEHSTSEGDAYTETFFNIFKKMLDSVAIGRIKEIGKTKKISRLITIFNVKDLWDYNQSEVHCNNVITLGD